MTYWDFDSTGDHFLDCENGKAYADRIIADMRARDLPPMFGNAIRAFRSAGENDSRLIGFCHRVAERLIAR